MTGVPRDLAETRRLAALEALEVMDSAPEPAFDALVRAASLACGVPISLVSLVDDHRQWFKANLGLDGATETPRDIAFCAHAIGGTEVFEVPDASRDPRFAANPLVLQQPNIRFYAGMPLSLSNGYRVGTLCVIDRTPRTLTAEQREILRCLGIAAAHALEGRRALTQLRLTQVELQVANARLSAATDSGQVGIWEFELASRAGWWDAWMYRLYGLPPEGARMTWDGWRALLPPESFAAVRAAVDDAISGKSDFFVEFAVKWPDGSLHWLRNSARVERDPNGKPVRFVGTSWDITESKQVATALREQSIGDELTGLLNRRGFLEIAGRRLLETGRTGQRAYLLFADLDGMKRINDELGHEAGDAALKATATVLKQTLRGSDTVARLGGDEFVALLVEGAEFDSTALVQRLEAAVARNNAEATGRPFQLAVSFGVSGNNAAGEDISLVLKRADEAMYAKKQERKRSPAKR